MARTRPRRGRCPAQPAAVQAAPGLRRRHRGRAVHDPAVPARRLGRPGSRRRGHPPGRIIGCPAALGSSVGASAHRAIRGRARLPPRRRRSLDRRDPPPANRTPPARPGMLRSSRAGSWRNRTRRSGPGRPRSSPAWLHCGKAATATSCRPSPPRTTWPKPSASTASSASACATSSASHPAQPHASSTSSSSLQPEQCRKQVVRRAPPSARSPRYVPLQPSAGRQPRRCRTADLARRL